MVVGCAWFLGATVSAVAATCTKSIGEDMATRWCNSPASRCPDAEKAGDWVALRSGSARGAGLAWRCYAPQGLDPSHSKYATGTGYCTRDAEIAKIVAQCVLPPPPPPPPPPSNATEVFVPGEGGYPCIRIPSVILAPDNRTLVALAECRNFTGDGCEPVAFSAARNANRDICSKRSVDGGRSWSVLRVIARSGSQATPVITAGGKLLVQYDHIGAAATMQMESEDDGATWSEARSVCGPGGLQPGACGGAVGPGVGIRLQRGPHAGRLLFIGAPSPRRRRRRHSRGGPAGHFGAYRHDTVWYSDDDGATYTASASSTQTLVKMDEAQLVELPDGSVLANMRNAHLNRTCDCRATSVSSDGGATWGPIVFDPLLPSPVCMATVLRTGAADYYFANPASKTSRANGVLRHSTDGVHWTAAATVWPGAFGYSCLTLLPKPGSVGLLWETDGEQCVGTGASCRIVFTAFDTQRALRH